MNTKKPVLELTLPEFYRTLEFVIESIPGDFGVQELEKQVLDAAKVVPMLTDLLGGFGEARERLDNLRPLLHFKDSEINAQFLATTELFGSLQGSLAMLLLVSQALQKQTVPKPRTRKGKKS